MHSDNALPKRKNKYGYWVDITHPSFPHAPTPGILKATQVSPKRLRINTNDTQSSAEQSKSTEPIRQFDSRKQSPVVVGIENGRSTTSESGQRPAHEPFAATPCPDSSVISNKPFLIPFSSTDEKIESTKEYVGKALQSEDNRCQRDSILESNDVDIEHLFTFTASDRRKRSTKPLKLDPIELPSPLTKRFRSISLITQHQNDIRANPITTVYAENLSGRIPREHKGLGIWRQLDQAEDGKDAIPTVQPEEVASQTSFRLPASPIPLPFKQSESVVSSTVNSRAAPRARRKPLPVPKTLRESDIASKKAEIPAQIYAPAGKDLLCKPNTEGSGQVLPLSERRCEPTSAQVPSSSKSVTITSTRLSTQNFGGLPVNCDIIDLKNDRMEYCPRSKNRGTRGVAVLKKPAAISRRRYKTPLSRIAPKNAVTPVRIAKFKKAEAKALEWKTSGVQRQAKIFNQKIQIDGLAENRLGLFWTTLGELKTSGKLFTGLKRMDSEEGRMSCFDNIENCIKAVNEKISHKHEKFGGKEGTNAIYELQNQRMLTIAGVKNLRVFLTRDAQAVLGA